MDSIDSAEFDPELRTMARLLPRGLGLQHSLTIARAVVSLAARMGRVRGVEVADVNPDVAVRVHRPVRMVGSTPALLWIHGGGTVMGSAAQEDRFCRRLVDVADVAVVAVDHRLAPEYPYPTPLEDCYAALVWLANQPWVDPTRIAVGGVSAGGGFAAGVAQLARDRGEVDVALQMMVYPMLDDRTGADGDDRERVMWSARDNQLAWAWYLAGADPTAAAPARRTDLRGLPPAWIGVGTMDLFYRECIVYGDRLRQAGTPVHTEIAEGAFHAFDLIAAKTSVSRRFFASQCRSLRAALVEDVTRM